MRKKHSAAAVFWPLAAVALAGLACYWWHLHHPERNSDLRLPSASLTNATLPAPGAGTKPAAQQKTQLTPVRVGQGLEQPTNEKPWTNSNGASDKNIRAPSTVYPRAVQNVFEMQVALARQGLSCGSIDGLIGPQTRAALRSFQQKEHLPITGGIDDATRACLLLADAPTTVYEVTSNDMARLQPLGTTWLGKSQQTALEYETVLELVSERAYSHPALIRQLNPELDWVNIGPGARLELPSISNAPSGQRAAFVVIHLEGKSLEAWDENTNLLAHFPCSIARRVEKRPVGELHVTVIVHNPNYTLDPENFPESAEAQQLKTKLVLPPGPNNPVGTAWIGLDKPGYGIHGTPSPEQVGRTESHGCFRLANWNAEHLTKLVEVGTPVYVQP